MKKNLTGLIERLSSAENGGVPMKTEYPLSSLTTFRIGGPCDCAVFPRNMKDYLFTLDALRGRGIPYRVIGHGSNLLCSDAGYRGIVVVTDGVNEIGREGNTLSCECGASLSAVANAAQRASLAGAEFLYGIPGTVGGGVYMNAGAYGGEIAKILSFADAYDFSTGTVRRFSASELMFGYRHSLFSGNDRYAILRAGLLLSPGNGEEILGVMKDLIERRREKQPLEYPSAGSTFKRCGAGHTSKMIDDAGLKGLTVGGCRVSEKHAGFVINAGGATARDVKELIRQIKERVYRVYGVSIECEVEFFGESD